MKTESILYQKTFSNICCVLIEEDGGIQKLWTITRSKNDKPHSICLAKKIKPDFFYKFHIKKGCRYYKNEKSFKQAILRLEKLMNKNDIVSSHLGILDENNRIIFEESKHQKFLSEKIVSDFKDMIQKTDDIKKKLEYYFLLDSESKNILKDMPFIKDFVIAIEKINNDIIKLEKIMNRGE